MSNFDQYDEDDAVPEALSSNLLKELAVLKELSNLDSSTAVDAYAKSVVSRLGLIERNMRKGNDNEAYLAGHRQRGEPTLACASAPARLACSAARISMSDRCQCHCLRRRGTARGKGEVEGRAEGA